MTDEPIHVFYDFEARFLGQLYLLQRHDDGPGYATIPVADPA